ncbi:hypothetical protein CHUAL_004229 [Chamberlinius hualienensis]
MSQMNETAGEILQQLCSHLKIDRDKGIQSMEKVVISADNELVNWLGNMLLCKVENDSETWECKHGSLMGLKCIIPHMKRTNANSEQFLQSCKRVALHLLSDGEVRVRLAAGEVLGVLCQRWGCHVYQESKDFVLEMIKSSLERQPTEPDVSLEENQHIDKLVNKFTGNRVERRMSADEIFHDTAGWKTLETSMKALQYMVDGCGQDFIVFINQELFDVICRTFTHTNRFVRETAFYVCSSLVNCSQGNQANVLFDYGHQFCHFLGLGMSDNWSQVRLAASVATRQFLLSIPNEQDRELFYPELLPKMCLNRYYLADGVRLYSQETWKIITQSQGKELVQKYIQQIVKFYVAQTEADNHAVREASCSCIAELASKMPKECVSPYVSQLLDTLILCFRDDSWPVRDAACLACGNFISCFPEECRPSLEALFPLFYANLEDNITSVRQGAAAALANVVKVYEDDVAEVVMNKLECGLRMVDKQPSESEKYGNLDKGPATFGVVKRLRDNDMELHTNQTMYSCGSLAPKMGRGRLGGCLDRTFRRPPQPWEITDGFVFLMSELALLPKVVRRIEKLLPLLSEVAGKRHFTHHYILLETICKQLPVIAKGVGKREFKRYAELFFEPLFYSLSCENILTSAAANQSIVQLSQLLGPGIMRGRIELFNSSYLQKFDECVGSSLM